MPNDTATEKAGSAENRDDTIAHGFSWLECPTSLTIGRAIRPIEHPIDLARHDKIVLVQSLDFLSAKRNGRVTPAETDIGVMAFGFSQVTNVSNKAKRFLKITKAKGSLDTVAPWMETSESKSVADATDNTLTERALLKARFLRLAS